MQTPLLDWNIDPSVGTRTPDTPSSSSDNPTSWQYVFNNGLNELPPHSNLDDSIFEQLMSPLESVRNFVMNDSVSAGSNG